MRATNYSFISSFDYGFIRRYQAFEEDMLTPERHRSHFVFLATRNADSRVPEPRVTS
jgi:hypothetical protein